MFYWVLTNTVIAFFSVCVYVFLSLSTLRFIFIIQKKLRFLCFRRGDPCLFIIFFVIIRISSINLKHKHLSFWHKKNVMRMENFFCWLLFLVSNFRGKLRTFNKKQDIYGFLVKNLDLDSNLYHMKNASKKLVKYYGTYPNPKIPYSWTLPLRWAQTRQQILPNSS
jgi:hypothetical protein